MLAGRPGHEHPARPVQPKGMERLVGSVVPGSGPATRFT